LDQKNELLVSVKDTGYGIPKKDHPKIFSKLFRADNAVIRETEGNGLGLYIVKAIIEQAGGKIWFESEENKGTNFFCTISKKGMSKKVGQKRLSE
jgi:two-component system sensor histidine kinase VicK